MLVVISALKHNALQVELHVYTNTTGYKVHDQLYWGELIIKLIVHNAHIQN